MGWGGQFNVGREQQQGAHKGARITIISIPKVFRLEADLENCQGLERPANDKPGDKIIQILF